MKNANGWPLKNKEKKNIKTVSKKNKKKKGEQTNKIVIKENVWIDKYFIKYYISLIVFI